MPEKTEQFKRRSVIRRRIFGAGVLLLLLAAVGVVVAYRHFTSPDRVRVLAQSYLQRYFRGPVSVGTASFSWKRGLKLFDVTVSEPPGAQGRVDAAPSDDPVFSCREIRLTHDSLSALWGDMKIHSITAVAPTCLIARDVETGRTNIQELLLAGPLPASTEAAVWPRVELREARVRVVSRSESGNREVEDLSLNVRAMPSKRGPIVYDIVWQEESGRVASGHSQIDLQTGSLRNVRDGLPWMSIEAVMLVINAGYDGVGAWSDLLGLDGTVRARDYQFPSGTSGDEPRSATIELSNASLSIPISDEEQPLEPDQRYLNFKQVNGHVQLTGREIHAVFSGAFHGSPCEVSMTLRAGEDQLNTLDDVHVDARLSMKDLVLPRPHGETTEAEARFIRRNRHMARAYSDFDPEGIVDLDVAVTKNAGPDEAIQVRRMDLIAKKCSGQFRMFPYRVYDMKGTITLTPEEFALRDIRGTHGDGLVHVEAWMKEPTRNAKKTVLIKGSNISADEDLYQALPDRFKVLWDKFDPEGKAEVSVELQQPELTSDMPLKWSTYHTIDVTKMAAKYEGFPYPVHDLHGTLFIGPDRFELRDVRGKAGPAEVEINGLAGIAGKGMSSLDLSIKAKDVPFDDTLRSALPEQGRDWLDHFDVEGGFDVMTRVQMETQGAPITYVADVRLNGISGTPEIFPVRIDDVLGHLRLAPNEILIEGVTGKFKEGTVAIDGHLNVASEAPAYGLTVRSRDVRLDSELRAALPENYREMLAGWTVDGNLKTHTVVSCGTTDESQKQSVRTTVSTESATIKHTRMPLALRDVNSTVSIDETGFRTDSFEGHYGAASVEGAFHFPNENMDLPGTLTLSARNLLLDKQVRDLCGDDVRGLWDRLGVSGTIDLFIDRLEFRRGETDGSETRHINARAELVRTNLAGIANMQNLEGSVVAKGMLSDRLGGTSLRGEIKLDSLEAFGHPIRKTSGLWSLVRTSTGEGMFELNEIAGSLHEGALTGRITADFGDERTEFSLTQRVRGMQLQPFVEARPTNRRSGKPPVDAAGLVDASIHLSGLVGDSEALRGGGRIDIHDANIYKTPLMLAILHVLNLSAPQGNAIEDVKVDFLVSGRRVFAEEIEMSGKLLALVGSGTMSLPDFGLDLRLVHVNPKHRTRVPVLTDMIEGASRGLVELQVTGPLSQPKVQTMPLGGIAQEFRKLLRPLKPKPSESSNPGRS